MLSNNQRHYQTLRNDGPSTGDSSQTEEEDEVFTVTEGINAVGLGCYQLRISCSVALICMASGIESMVRNILGPALVCDWNLNKAREATTVSVVYFGQGIGSLVVGWFFDKYGRKKGLILICSISTIYGFLACLAPDFYWLLFLRMMAGVGHNYGLQSMTYFSEFLPPESKGHPVITMQCFPIIGAGVAAALALKLINQFNWRMWLAISTLPSLIATLMMSLVEESPYYELISGNEREAEKILRRMAKQNKKTLPSGSLKQEALVSRGQFQDLFNKETRFKSVMLSFLWFSVSFLFYGYNLFSTDLIDIGDTCHSGMFYSQNCSDFCIPMTTKGYLDLVIVAIADIPGMFGLLILSNKMERKSLLSSLMFISSIICFVLCICLTRNPMTFLLALLRLCLFMPFPLLSLYTLENYPTHVRALAIGMGSLACRLGAIITPYPAQVLMSHSNFAGLTSYAVIAFIAGVSALFLPKKDHHQITTNQVTA